MSFQQRKKDTLERIDKSSIGGRDVKIKKLIDKINKRKEYYTTSSCSGRIVLIKASEKKQEGLFLFRWHDKITFSKLKEELKKAGKNKGLIYFKQEPCILHVACSSIGDAQKLFDKAKLAGWKDSGIIASSKRAVCQLRSTEKLEMPIMNKGKILADEDFLRLLVKEANRKLERIWSKIKRLERGV